MGYYVSYVIDTTVVEGNEAEALATINALHTPKIMKLLGGGSHGYSWVRNPPEGEFKTLEEAFAAWRFEFFPENNSFNFVGEKLGDEEVLFNALAPYLTIGDIYGRGGDGAEWGYRFTPGCPMIHLSCVKTWVED